MFGILIYFSHHFLYVIYSTRHQLLLCIQQIMRNSEDAFNFKKEPLFIENYNLQFHHQKHAEQKNKVDMIKNKNVKRLNNSQRGKKELPLPSNVSHHSELKLLNSASHINCN